MSKNIEINYKNSSGYEVLYPRTDYRCVIDLLSDSTKSLMGLGADGTPDDAFRSLFKSAVLGDKCSFKLVVKSKTSGTPMPNIPVVCSSYIDINGNSVASPLYTNANGEINTYFKAGSVTLSITGYTDIANISQQYTVKNGEIYEYEWSLTTRTMIQLITSGNAKFSSNVSSIDVTVVGGGGGGGSGSYGDDDRSGGRGGGGGYCVVKSYSAGQFSINTNLPYVIGSGGQGQKTKSDGSINYNTGGNGGTSTFLDLSAKGGTQGNPNGGTGGVGNGKGGEGASRAGYASNGVAGNTLGWLSFNTQVRFGGGGGGGANLKYLSQTTGGADFGGPGAGTPNVAPTAPVANRGGGGGGGLSGPGGYYTNGASGSAGIITIRMHLKIA